MAPSESTWGIPKPVRQILAARINELRVGLQEDARRQLAALGIAADRVGPPPGGRVLSADEARTRDVVLAVLDVRRDSGVDRDEAMAAYVEEVAFTLLDRLVAFRCLEERGLLLIDGQAETLVRREPVRGMSSLVWRTRDARPDLDERGVARAAYRAACAAMTDRVRVLFDPTDEASALFPTLPLWQKALDALNDPAIHPWVFAEDEVMGWVYQYWSSQLKDEVYAKLAKGGKIEDPKELAAATTLYTERYIVDYLVQNTLGTTWVEMHPDTSLPGTWPYYVRPPEDNPPVEREPKRVRDITLIDPCVGSGHFLVRAFDVFVQLYTDEGIEDPRDVPALILERNLFGADIDRRAIQIAALTLYVKGCALAGADFRPRTLNLVACDIAIPSSPPAEFLDSLPEAELKDLAWSLWTGLAGIRTFGSLLHPERAVDEAFAKLKSRSKGTLWEDDTDWARQRTEFMAALREAFTTAAGDTDLSTRLFGEEASRGLDALDIFGRRYDVVLTNPPYLRASKGQPELRAYLRREYAKGAHDLFLAFILRARDLCREGRVGMVTQQAWMFLVRYRATRHFVLDETTVESIAHLGSNAFEEIQGEVVSVAAFVLRNTPSATAHRFNAQRLVSLVSAQEKASAMAARPSSFAYSVGQAQIRAIPESPFAYWLVASVADALGRGNAVSSLLAIPVGLQTFGDDQYVRMGWEIIERNSWRRFAKGGGYSRWAGLEWWWVSWPSGERAIPDPPPGTLANVEFYDKPGFTYTDLAQGSLSVRIKSPEVVLGNPGPGVFVRPDARLSEHAPGLLNSRLATYAIRGLAPGQLHFRTGYVGRLPAAYVGGEAGGFVPTCVALKKVLVATDPKESSFVRISSEVSSELGVIEVLLASAEALIEHHALDNVPASELREVLEETGVPAGWHPLLVGYDRLPKAPTGIEAPGGLADFLASLERRDLSASGLAKVKTRLRALYEAGPGAKVVDEAQSSGSDDEEEGSALGARIPIPTETFLEELSVKLELHPISVHWLLEELKAEGVVSPPLRKAELEEYLDVTLVRMLGYRWPEQDAHEAEHGPILDPDLVDADGIIPLVPCGDEPVAETRVRTRLVRQLGEDGADAFLADLKRYTKRDLGDWIRRDLFKSHTKRFKNRPIAWHLRSPEGAFEVLVLYHRLSRDTLARLRVTYAGERLARLRAEQQRARERGDAGLVTNLQSKIEDVEAFRRIIESIERGDELKHRIRCRWKDENEQGRPGPYAPDIDDGVKVNIRPFQESGLLPSRVITKW